MANYELYLKYTNGEYTETASAELLNCEAHLIIDFIYKLLHYRMDGDTNTENVAIEKMRKVMRDADVMHNKAHFTGLPYNDICTHKTVIERNGEIEKVIMPYIKKYDLFNV